MIAAKIILLAAVAQVALTLWSTVTLGLARIACLKTGALTLGDIALDDTRWPDEIKKLQANNRSQYETPVLFFAGVAIALATGSANWGVAVFAVLFIASRIVHRMIHVGSNRVGKRFKAFVAGLAALAGLWLSLLIDALF